MASTEAMAVEGTPEAMDITAVLEEGTTVDLEAMEEEAEEEATEAAAVVVKRMMMNGYVPHLSRNTLRIWR